MTFIYCRLILKTHLQYSPIPGGESDRMIPIFKETKVEMWSSRSKGTFLVTGGMWALPGLSYSVSCGFVPFLMPLVHQQDVKLQVLDLRPKHQEKCFTNWDKNKSLGLWRAILSYLGNLGSQSDFWGLASLLCPLVTGSQRALRLVPADGSLMTIVVPPH